MLKPDAALRIGKLIFELIHSHQLGKERSTPHCQEQGEIAKDRTHSRSKHGDQGTSTLERILEMICS